MSKKPPPQLSGSENPFIQELRTHISEQGGRPGSRRVPDEVLLSTAVVLIEVALIDSELSRHQQNIIQSGLCSLFGISGEAVVAIIAQAKNTFMSMRGSSSYAEVLRDYLDPTSKRMIAELIDELIISDGTVSGFEIYLRNRLLVSLGIATEAASLPEGTKMPQSH